MKIRRAAAAAIGIGVVVAGPTLAVAEPGGTPPPRQPDTQTVHEAVDQVAELSSAFWAHPGFGKVKVDYDKISVEVYWKGAPPAEVAELNGAVVDGVQVSVVEVARSQHELVAAGLKILATERDRVGPHNVVAAMPNASLSGIVVEILRGSDVAKSVPDATQRYRSLVNLPVEVRTVEEEVAPATRQNDSAPWQGGGALADSTGDDYCSVGFAIVRADGTGRLLSASHCDDDRAIGAVMRDGVGDRIGVMSNRDHSLDSELIDPDASPATIGKVFGGPWNATPSHARYQWFVVGAAAPAEGQEVCASGARSGEHCNRIIRETSISFNCGHASDCTGFRASGSSGTVSAAIGDSGGQIYTEPDSNGWVRARGIISAVSGSTDCGSTAEPTTCYTSVYGIGIHGLLNRWDATIDVE
jgi:hypothetical protein